MDKKDIKKEIDDYIDSSAFKRKINDLVTDIMETFVDSMYQRKSQIKNMSRKFNESKDVKTIILKESQLDNLEKELCMTEYRFVSNIKHFLADLLDDPVNAEVPLALRMNKFDDRNILIKTLCDDGIIVRKQNISDKDESGNPKTATMLVSYTIPKKDFDNKLRQLYSRLYEPYTEPANDEDILDEDGGGATACDGASGAFEAPFLTTPVKRKFGR